MQKKWRRQCPWYKQHIWFEYTLNLTRFAIVNKCLIFQWSISKTWRTIIPFLRKPSHNKNNFLATPSLGIVVLYYNCSTKVKYDFYGCLQNNVSAKCNQLCALLKCGICPIDVLWIYLPNMLFSISLFQAIPRLLYDLISTFYFLVLVCRSLRWSQQGCFCSISS